MPDSKATATDQRRLQVAVERYQQAIQELFGRRYRDGECDAVALSSLESKCQEIEEFLQKDEEELGPVCLDCCQPAVWMRYTQFSGDHPYCGEHARQQRDFGQENPSYFVWRKIKEG